MFLLQGIAKFLHKDSQSKNCEKIKNEIFFANLCGPDSYRDCESLW